MKIRHAVKHRQGGRSANRSLVAIAVLLSMAVVLGTEGLMPASAWALDISTGPLKGRLDTTVSTGVAIRVEERDPRIVAQTNGGTGYDPDVDDGNLNFDQGDVTSLNIKVLHEIDLGWKNYGFFGRFYYFYDWAIMKFDPRFRAFTENAQRRAGLDIRLLDLYVVGDYEVFNRPLTVRLGNQVLSWGESTFIQNGINSINPVDVTALRLPGSQLKEALLPVPMISINAGISDSLSFEAFYQLFWDNTEIEPFGTYFSTNDQAGPGASRVTLGFGLPPPEGPTDNPVQPVGTRPPIGSWIPRKDDNEPSHMGQGGVALRYFASWLYETELGLYWEHIHSRRPVLSGITGDPPPDDPLDVLIWGLVNGDGASTSGYFREFPENIDIVGMSWNTVVPFGVAFQGEVSGRLGQPIQIDGFELVAYGQSPYDPTLAELATLENLLNPDIPPEDAQVTPPIFGNSQLTALRGAPGFNQYTQGWERKDMLQAQATFTKLFGPNLGADDIAFLFEVGATWFFGMEDKDVLRYDGPGTETSGNSWWTEAGLQPFTTEGGFADSFSWGYRLVLAPTFNNAIGAVTLTPIFAWAHDVEGVTPIPISNFVAGTKAMSLMLNAVYLQKIQARLAYTMFFGGGKANLLHDRDFISLSASYSF
jgi:hypothetical protein